MLSRRQLQGIVRRGPTHPYSQIAFEQHHQASLRAIGFAASSHRCRTFKEPLDLARHITTLSDAIGNVERRNFRCQTTLICTQEHHRATLRPTTLCRRRTPSIGSNNKPRTFVLAPSHRTSALRHVVRLPAMYFVRSISGFHPDRLFETP
jgi:hypothetical protein